MTMTDTQDSEPAQAGQARPLPGRAALHVGTYWSGRSEVLTVAGEIDLNVAGPLRDEITQCLDAGPEALIVDLSAVTFLSSSGLSALVDAHRMSAPDTAVRIVAADRAVLRPLQITHLDRVLPVYPTVDRALAAD